MVYTKGTIIKASITNAAASHKQALHADAGFNIYIIMKKAHVRIGERERENLIL